jgi:hypothetical protein
VHLPSQLAEVDPIVASFCGGAVGVLSALLIVEENNIKKQQKTRCFYCKGTGYLMCGNCIGSGLDPATNGPCTCCARSGKVMCTGCLCTGKHLATEHDPRIDLSLHARAPSECERLIGPTRAHRSGARERLAPSHARSTAPDLGSS